jgi:integrase
LPQVSFHALRHIHVSTLVAANLDVVSISRRMGHGSPVLTLKANAHLL